MQTAESITNVELEIEMAFFDTPLIRPYGQGRAALFTVAMRAFEVRRQRTALRRLTDSDLSDIGLTRADVDRELAKSFWDVPDTWRA